MDIKEVVKTAILRNSHEWGDEQAEAVLKAINEAGFLVVPAKAQAVPEGFVLVSKDTLNKALNPNDYDEAVCSANELLAVIEAQEPANEL